MQNNNLIVVIYSVSNFVNFVSQFLHKYVFTSWHISVVIL